MTVGQVRAYKESTHMGIRILAKILQRSPEAVRRLLTHGDDFPIDIRPNAEYPIDSLMGFTSESERLAFYHAAKRRDDHDRYALVDSEIAHAEGRGDMEHLEELRRIRAEM